MSTGPVRADNCVPQSRQILRRQRDEADPFNPDHAVRHQVGPWNQARVNLHRDFVFARHEAEGLVEANLVGQSSHTRPEGTTAMWNIESRLYRRSVASLVCTW